MSPIVQMGRPRLRPHSKSRMSSGGKLCLSALKPLAEPWGPCLCKLRHGPFPSPTLGTHLGWAHWPNPPSSPHQPRVTFSKESPVPEKSWRFRPYLGYDWIAGAACPMHTLGPGVAGGSPAYLPEPAPAVLRCVSAGPPSWPSTPCTCALSAPGTVPGTAMVLSQCSSDSRFYLWLTPPLRTPDLYAWLSSPCGRVGVSDDCHVHSPGCDFLPTCGLSCFVMASLGTQ